jgi:hypothetical protein
MTKFKKGGDFTPALKAENYQVGDVISELATIISVKERKDSFNAGQFKNVGNFIDTSGEFSVFINCFSMDNLIDAYGDENGEIEDTELIGKSVTITVVNDERTRNKNAFEVTAYKALSVEELNKQKTLTDDKPKPKPKTEPRMAIKPPAASKPAEPARASKTARKPA